MANDTLRYDKLVENALRGVVRDALAVTAERGLPGAHHFYVTFRTNAPGVDIPGFLRAQYPQEMTIVIEHQFWGLEVDAVRFGITLSFQGQSHRLTIPLSAIKTFADPSVNFCLEFPQDQTVAEAPPLALAPEPAETPAEATPAPAADKAGAVVKLDAFRKK
jgi:hypothetical protein